MAGRTNGRRAQFVQVSAAARLGRHFATLRCMALPNGSEPWLGLDQGTLRFLEVHPARAVIIPGRGWRDMDDAVMLFSSIEKEPFFNRLTAVRWPSDPGEFDRRLSQACELFVALDRKPYMWVIPGLTTPPDIVGRLAANGFVDQGGGYDMVLTEEPSSDPVHLPPGAVLEHWNAPAPEEVPAKAAALALVIGEAFGIPQERHANLAREIGLTMARPDFHAYVLSIDGEPVATGERYTFDGASYLSSIGTRPAWRGRGFARAITRTLALDSLGAGIDLIYLGVYAENTGAMRLYRDLGFSIFGPRSADMLQEHPH
jgi:ribosomal protein S18 acetylase RimI-like enzyme